MKTVGWLVAGALLSACAGGTVVTTGDGGEPRLPVNDIDSQPQLGDGKPATPDLGREWRADPDVRWPEEEVADLPDRKGLLGDACEGNDDCEGGFCVPSDIGHICTQLCIDDCPQDWVCKGVPFTEPDTIFVCMPTLDQICRRSGVCEPEAVENESCGNCGKRDRSCNENCQWGSWSNCFGEGQCVAGIAEADKCGNCGARQRLCSQECAWEEWSECSGEGECTPGGQETEPCGLCATRTRVCTQACYWSDWGSCANGGVCEPDQMDTQGCGKCGSQLRICTANCTWSEWGECANEGACAAGESMTQNCGKCGHQSRSCTSECQWAAWGSCESQGVCTPDESDVEPCGDCGLRTRICTDECIFGDWEECLGQGACTPGQSKTEPCGKCGTRQSTCTAACQWSEWGGCQGEGICAIGEVSTQSCGNCGKQSRTCSNTCTWGGWGNCGDQGECAPGQAKPCNLCGTQTCTAQCAYGLCNLGVVDGYEENDSKAASSALPGITDAAGDSQTVTANINPASDPDWYKIHIADITWHAINPKVTISVPAGQTYQLCVTYDCDKGTKEFSQCKNVTGTTASIELDVGGCQSVWDGDDDSGTAYIQVNPVTSGSCTNYSVKTEA